MYLFPKVSVKVIVCVVVEALTKVMIVFPAVFAFGNACASDATPLPCTAALCTRFRPEPVACTTAEGCETAVVAPPGFEAVTAMRTVELTSAPESK